MDPVLFQIAFGHADRFGGDPFAFQLFDRFDTRGFGDRQDPAQRIAADFAVNQFRSLIHVRTVFLDPVKSGQAAVQHAFFHVARHFLRTDQHAFDLRIVDRRIIGTRTDLNFIACFGEHRHGRFFQTAFRESQHQLCHCHISCLFLWIVFIRNFMQARNIQLDRRFVQNKTPIFSKKIGKTTCLPRQLSYRLPLFLLSPGTGRT